MNKTPVLYARKNSIYKKLDNFDVYDENRDALTFSDNQAAVIAHPPCRLWGRLRTFSKADIFEKYLALHAVLVVQENGGILEHPAHSQLWKSANLPRPGVTDQYGGFTLPILQSWFGHKAPKATFLYIVGISPKEIPLLPYQLGIPTGRISKSGSMLLREGTPKELAIYMQMICRLIDQKKGLNNETH